MIFICLFLCVFQDLISVLLPRVLPAITVGLQDLDDDVRAVAAAALIPVVEGLVQLLPNKVRGAKQMSFQSLLKCVTSGWLFFILSSLQRS